MSMYLGVLCLLGYKIRGSGNDDRAVCCEEWRAEFRHDDVIMWV